MGRQYICDYCLRSFRDSRQSRKKHLKSSEHLRARDEYFRQIKTTFDTLKDEANKSVCHHFFNTGFCRFGDNCIHSHLTYDRLQELKRRVVEEELGKYEAKSATTENSCESEPHLNIWLKNRFNCEALDTINVKNSEINELRQMLLSLGPQQIPVSLIPPSAQDLAQSEESDWN